MNKHVNSLKDEFRPDRQELTTQIKDLVDVMKRQNMGNSSTPVHSTCNSISSTRNPTTHSPNTHTPPILFGGNIPQITPRTTHTVTMMAPPVFAQTPPYIIPSITHPQPPITTVSPTTDPPFSTQFVPHIPVSATLGFPPNLHSHTPDFNSFRHHINVPYMLPKVDFPKFEGTNARSWVAKAEKFFMLNPGMDAHTKVVFTSLYLDGEADHWFHTIHTEQRGIIWDSFVDQLLRCFSSGNQENLVGRFNKLVQKGSVKPYIAEFEELRGYMMLRHNWQSDEFYLASFMSGLCPDIQQALYVYKPSTLSDAMEKAAEQETLMDLMEK